MVVGLAFVFVVKFTIGPSFFFLLWLKRKPLKKIIRLDVRELSVMRSMMDELRSSLMAIGWLRRESLYKVEFSERKKNSGYS